MKRIFLVFFSLVLFLSLCACGKSRNVNECIDLINNITSIDTIGTLLPQGEIGYFDKGFKEYETAKAKYDELSESEKSKVDNAYILEEHKADYEKAKNLLITLETRRTIGLECKEAAVDNIKKNLKNPASYEEVDWSMVVGTDILEIGKGSVLIDLTYSATNSFGGRLQEESKSVVYVTYESNALSIEKITIL